MFPRGCKESNLTAMTQYAHALQDSAIPFLGIYQKKTKTLIQKYVCTQMFTATLFTIVKIYRNNLSFHSHEWIQKIYMCQCVCVCVCTIEYYQPLKRIKFCQLGQHDRSGGYRTQQNVRQRKTNTVCFQFYMKSKSKTN